MAVKLLRPLLYVKLMNKFSHLKHNFSSTTTDSKDQYQEGLVEDLQVRSLQ